MRITRAIGVIGVSCAWVIGCASGGAYEPGTETYVVQPRDTLYSIAWRHDLDYRELARWNHIGSDYRITIGQVLVLKGGGSAPAAHAAPPPRAAAPSRGAAVAHGAAAPRVADSSSAADARAAAAAPPPLSAGACAQWGWPTQHSSTPRAVAGGGILLPGQEGQAVRAACSGRVVYIGSGLRGYGNLIIIKHSDSLLSAYAHNREALVHEGQEVALGQDIARMGLGAHQEPVLYFEIRVNGKPVDPLRYLAAAK